MSTATVTRPATIRAAVPSVVTPRGNWLQRLLRIKPRARHRLDDPTTDRVLLLLFVIAQGWSTYGMYQLAKWAGFDDITAAVPAILIDGVAFICARSASSNFLPNEKGWRVRTLAGVIAGACFVLALAGNVVNSHVRFDVAGDPDGPFKLLLHDAFSGAPVLLLIGTLVLRTRRGAWKEHVVAIELRDAAQAAERAERAAVEQAAAAEQRRRDEEAEQRRDRAAREERDRAEAAARDAQARDDRREREAREHTERVAQQERDAELRRIELEAAAAATAQRGSGTRADPRPVGARASAGVPQSGLSQKARDYILTEWQAGREPTGPEVERAIGATVGGGLGRKEIRAVKGLGHVPPSGKAETDPAETATPGREPLALAVG